MIPYRQPVAATIVTISDVLIKHIVTTEQVKKARAFPNVVAMQASE